VETFVDVQAPEQQFMSTSSASADGSAALVFDGMFDGVWLVAADGRTTYANATMAGSWDRLRTRCAVTRSPTSSMSPMV